MEKIVIEIISHVLCLIIGGIAGYNIKISQKSSQIQKAGNNANQVQISNSNNGSNNGQ